ALNSTQYEGNVEVLSKRKQDRFMLQDSRITGNYSGDIVGLSPKHRKQELEGKSLNMYEYRGEVRIKRHYARDKYFRNISDRNQQIIGNYRTKTRLTKDIEEQIASARVQNYQGGPKAGLFTRIWLSLFDNSGKLEKMDEKTKEPKYDSREYKIWY
ncbi:MAG: hypothetical protein KAR17_22940, partial [Cyclobacteriaceae bacterium]|nr:hypothetical protein [Cyclobacteriaceae bacterium]